MWVKVWFFCIINYQRSLVVEAGIEDTYAVNNNMVIVNDLLYEQILTTHQDVPALQFCSMKCTDHSKCMGAIYDTSDKSCVLFKTWRNKWLSHSDEKTSLIFLESYCRLIQCQYVKGGETCFELGKHDQCAERPLYQDCQDAFLKGERNSSDIYNIRPYHHGIVYEVRCLFDDFQGWTVIQQRYDGSIDFNVSKTIGIGSITGEFWLGEYAVQQLTNAAGNERLHIQMETIQGDVITANYSSFSLGADERSLTISGYSGDAGDGLSPLDGNEFSTFHYGSCGYPFGGRWWIDSCEFSSNLNGKWYSQEPANPRSGIYWMSHVLRRVKMLAGKDL